MKKSMPHPDISDSLLQYFRYGIQLSFIMVCVYTGFAYALNPGLPEAVFLAIIILSGMFFCGWLCPFGAVQEHLRPIGRKLGLTWRIPARIDRYLSYLRYVPGLLLPAVVWGFINAQGSFYRWFTAGITLSFAAIFTVIILVLSLAVERPFCKYLCSYGAANSLWSIFRLFTVRRKSAGCVKCGRCDMVCPMSVRISSVESVRDISCINCLKCVAACPKDDTLKFAFSVPSLRDYKRLIRPCGKGDDRA